MEAAARTRLEKLAGQKVDGKALTDTLRTEAVLA